MSDERLAVDVRGLTKTFGEVRAIDDLSIEIAKGEIFGLVGPDGAGKTTLMRVLASIMRPTSGDAWIFGDHVVRDARAIQDEIGYMSQRFGLYPDLTVLENLHFYADLYGVPRAERDTRVERLLSFSNMLPFGRRQAGKLSGGMKQKLGLACALIHSPKLLLLDEPTNGVDPVSRRDFWRILYQLLREGVTIVVSTAYLDEAERCTRVALMHRGKIVACDVPDRVKKLLPGIVLEIRAGNTREAAAALREASVAESIVLFGDRIHVVTTMPDETRAKIAKTLEAKGVTLTSIREVEPTLENVFVSMLTEEGSAA